MGSRKKNDADSDPYGSKRVNADPTLPEALSFAGAAFLPGISAF
jgi:hypothetical protein